MKKMDEKERIQKDFAIREESLIIKQIHYLSRNLTAVYANNGNGLCLEIQKILLLCDYVFKSFYRNNHIRKQIGLIKIYCQTVLALMKDFPQKREEAYEEVKKDIAKHSHIFQLHQQVLKTKKCTEGVSFCLFYFLFSLSSFLFFFLSFSFFSFLTHIYTHKRADELWWLTYSEERPIRTRMLYEGTTVCAQEPRARYRDNYGHRRHTEIDEFTRAVRNARHYGVPLPPPRNVPADGRYLSDEQLTILRLLKFDSAELQRWVLQLMGSGTKFETVVHRLQLSGGEMS
jgi:hypothetical protein